jgi:hypothetical protein
LANALIFIDLCTQNVLENDLSIFTGSVNVELVTIPQLVGAVCSIAFNTKDASIEGCPVFKSKLTVLGVKFILFFRSEHGEESILYLSTNSTKNVTNAVLSVLTGERDSLLLEGAKTEVMVHCELSKLIAGECGLEIFFSGSAHVSVK